MADKNSSSSGNTNTTSSSAGTGAGGLAPGTDRRSSGQGRFTNPLGIFKQLSGTKINTNLSGGDERRTSASSASGGGGGATSPGGFEPPVQDANGRRASQGRFSTGRV